MQGGCGWISACESVLPTQQVKTRAGCTPSSLRSLPSSSLARSSKLEKRSSSREITSDAQRTHLKSDLMPLLPSPSSPAAALL